MGLQGMRRASWRRCGRRMGGCGGTTSALCASSTAASGAGGASRSSCRQGRCSSRSATSCGSSWATYGAPPRLFAVVFSMLACIHAQRVCSKLLPCVCDVPGAMSSWCAGLCGLSMCVCIVQRTGVTVWWSAAAGATMRVWSGRRWRSSRSSAR